MFLFHYVAKPSVAMGLNTQGKRVIVFRKGWTVYLLQELAAYTHSYLFT